MAAELYLPPSECDFYSHKLVPMMLHVGFWPKNICKLFYICGNVEVHEENWIAVIVLWDAIKCLESVLCGWLAKVDGNLATWEVLISPQICHTELSLLKSEESLHLISTKRTLKKAPNQQTARNSFLITFVAVPLRWVSLHASGCPRETCEW